MADVGGVLNFQADKEGVMSEYTVEDRVIALETAFNVLLASLGDAGSLPQDTYLRNLCTATNELEAAGVAAGATRLLDAMREQHQGLFPEGLRVGR